LNIPAYNLETTENYEVSGKFESYTINTLGPKFKPV